MIPTRMPAPVAPPHAQSREMPRSRCGRRSSRRGSANGSDQAGRSSVIDRCGRVESARRGRRRRPGCPPRGPPPGRSSRAAAPPGRRCARTTRPRRCRARRRSARRPRRPRSSDIAGSTRLSASVISRVVSRWTFAAEIATVAWPAKTPSISMSWRENVADVRLSRTWSTPIAPWSPRSGAAARERGTYPVCSAASRLKRGSLATSDSASAWPVEYTKPTIPWVGGTDSPIAPAPCSPAATRNTSRSGSGSNSAIDAASASKSRTVASTMLWSRRSSTSPVRRRPTAERRAAATSAAIAASIGSDATADQRRRFMCPSTSSSSSVALKTGLPWPSMSSSSVALKTGRRGPRCRRRRSP